MQKNIASKHYSEGYKTIYIMVIAMQGDMNVWTRTGGHMDECK